MVQHDMKQPQGYREHIKKESKRLSDAIDEDLFSLLKSNGSDLNLDTFNSALVEVEGMKKKYTLQDVYATLLSAERHGGDIDRPEGTRTVTFSETLVDMMMEAIGFAITKGNSTI